MENPATWDEPTRVINQAIIEWEDAHGIIGLSLARYIRDALHDAGLLTTTPADPSTPPRFSDD
jgi:hypothetical protein